MFVKVSGTEWIKSVLGVLINEKGIMYFIMNTIPFDGQKNLKIGKIIGVFRVQGIFKIRWGKDSLCSESRD